MAKALLVCFRNSEPKNPTSFAESLAKRISPDNAVTNPPRIRYTDKVLSLVYNPVSSIRSEGQSLCLGLCDASDTLFTPKAPLPVGSYALFRANHKEIEVASDYAASRTMWYYSDDSIFVASTSQRMIVAVLGGFEFNKKACSWFLCTGTLGPGLSWDKRIKIIPPRTRIHLERNTWAVTIDKKENFSFISEKSGVSKTGSISDHRNKLKSMVKNAVSDLNFKPSQWTLALSGGMDSRSLLHHLNNEDLNAVTWGLKSAMEYKDSDARIGQSLAAHCNMSHHYAEMDFVKGSFPKLLDRFVSAGEGRIDHLAGYLDGLNLWGTLSASGRGVIRGYDAFGRKPPVSNSYQVRRTCNLMTSSDYSVNRIPEEFNLSSNDIPNALTKKTEESWEDWRDRLWLQHRTPITTAALEDIKLAYVEIVNPLLSENIIKTIQELPIKLRNNKTVWKSIILEMFPSFPLAKREAVQEVGDVLNLEEVKNFMVEFLANHNDYSIFSKDFTSFLMENYSMNHSTYSKRRRLRKLIIAYLPKKIENALRKRLKPGPLSNQWLALRVVMIIKIEEMMKKDSSLVNLLD